MFGCCWLNIKGLVIYQAASLALSVLIHAHQLSSQGVSQVDKNKSYVSRKKNSVSVRARLLFNQLNWHSNKCGLQKDKGAHPACALAAVIYELASFGVNHSFDCKMYATEAAIQDYTQIEVQEGSCINDIMQQFEKL